MSFVFEGFVITKKLPPGARERLVLDYYTRVDKAGRVSRFKRVAYYDPKKKHNVYVASKKLGELTEDGKLVEIIRRGSPAKAALAESESVTVINDVAEKTVDDPRQEAKVLYGIPVVLHVGLMAAMGGCSGSKAQHLYWRTNHDVLEEILGDLFPKSDPSNATLNRLLQLIYPKQFQSVYEDLVFPLLPQTATCEADKTVVAIDGQAVRASRNDQGRQHQFLTYYSTETGIAICQQLIGSKTNEKPAARELAKRLDLSGTIVTGDAMHCDRELLEILLNQSRADYCMAVKMNQCKTAEAIEAAFNAAKNPLCDVNSEKGHGRREVRTTYVLPGSILPKNILEKWHGLEFGCIVKQVSERTVITTKETSTQVRYFISSLSPDFDGIAKHVQRAVRSHWGIENKLHHVLDVDFYQDATQAKNANYVSNVAQLNKLALTVLEVVRRRHLKDGKTKRLTPIKSMVQTLQNNPRLATEYLDLFIRESNLAALNHRPEPLIK